VTDLLYVDFVCVSVPPEMLEGPAEFEGIEGEEANLTCNASGTPNPTFSFYKVLVILLCMREHLKVECIGV